jgi:hypothetical protein
MHEISTPWQDLPYAAWRETASTLQLWTQIVGKVRLALTPWLNHGWQVPLYVTARGLGTSPMPTGNDVLEIEFDFVRHRLVMLTSRGEERTLCPGTADGRRLLRSRAGSHARHRRRRNHRLSHGPLRT